MSLPHPSPPIIIIANPWGEVMMMMNRGFCQQSTIISRALR